MDVVQLPEDAISKIRPWSYTLHLQNNDIS